MVPSVGTMGANMCRRVGDVTVCSEDWRLWLGCGERERGAWAGERGRGGGGAWAGDRGRGGGVGRGQGEGGGVGCGEREGGGGGRGQGRGGGRGGVWDPKVWVPKRARSSFPDCNFRVFPRWSLWSGGGGGPWGCAGPSRAAHPPVAQGGIPDHAMGPPPLTHAPPGGGGGGSLWDWGEHGPVHEGSGQGMYQKGGGV